MRWWLRRYLPPILRRTQARRLPSGPRTGPCAGSRRPPLSGESVSRRATRIRFKLHYSWSLWRIGVGNELEFRHQAGAYREMVAGRRIGFADAYLVSIPDPERLELRMSGDTTRRRRKFALHARLGEPLRDWYAALEEVRPGSVRWSFPDEGFGAQTDATGQRYDLDSFDALIRRVAASRT